MPDPLEGRIFRHALRHGFISTIQAQDGLNQLEQRQPGCCAEDLLSELGWIDDSQLKVLRELRHNAPHPESSGSGIADFEIIREIGQGAMGSVYLARQRRINRLVAIKVLADKHLRDERYIKRFLREAQSSGRINHENIVGGIDVGKWKGTYYFAQEYVDGVTVDHLISKLGSLDEESSLGIVLKVGRALDHLIQHDLVHRDIKPDNIMLTHTGQVKVCDFGLAKDLNQSGLTTIGTSVGTPYYISPEQARGEVNIDIRADVYSLGVSLYHMLCGQPPFGSGSPYEIMVDHIKKPFPPLEDVEVHGETRELLGLMVTKNRERRLSPGQLVARVASIVDEGLVLPSRIESGRPAGKKKVSGRALKSSSRQPKRASGTRGSRKRMSTAKGRRAGPPKKSFAGLWAGVVVVALLLAANLAYMVSRERSDDRPDDNRWRVGQKKKPADGTSGVAAKSKARKVLDGLIAQRQALSPAGPLNLRPIIVGLDRLAKQHPRDPAAQEAGKRAVELRLDAEQLAQQRWGETIQQAKRLGAEEREYQAIDALRKVPGEADYLPVGKQVGLLREALRDAMQARFAKVMSQAKVALDEHVTESAIESAITQLTKVSDYATPKMVQEAAGVQQELKNRLASLGAEARQALDRKYEDLFLSRVLVGWRERRYADAEKVLLAHRGEAVWAGASELFTRDLAQTKQLARNLAAIEPLIADRVGGEGTFMGFTAIIEKVVRGQLWLSRKGRTRKAPQREVRIANLLTDEIGHWLEQGVYDRQRGADRWGLALFYYAEGMLEDGRDHLERAIGQGAPDRGLGARIQAAQHNDAEHAADLGYRNLGRQLSYAEPVEGVDLIESFLARFAKTALVGRKREELAVRRVELEAKIKKPSKKSPEKNPVIVKRKSPERVELKGRVRSGWEKTGRYDVEYWFRKESELADWENEKQGKDWRWRRGALWGKVGGSFIWRPVIRGDFRIRLEYRSKEGTDDLALLFRAPDNPKRGYRLVVKASGSQPEWATYANKSVLQRLDPEPVTLDATVFPQRIARNTLHAIEVRRQGGRFWVELDGKPLLSARDVTFDKVHFAVRHFYSEVREVRVKLFSYIGALEPPRKKD